MPLLTNRDLVLSVARFRAPMAYWYRYAHGDELLFVHEGHGMLETQFGLLEYRPGDYLVLPTGVVWRLLPRADEPQRMLCVEAAGHIEPPRRYVNRYGQFLENSPYCERDIRQPEWVDAHDEEGEFEVRVKARGGVTRYLYRRHPMDVVGWDGHLWPYAFNIEDFEPITGRVHQPPPVHQTFDGPGSSSAPSCRGCSTTTRRRFPLPTTTRTSIRTRSSTTSRATSCRGAEWSAGL